MARLELPADIAGRLRERGLGCDDFRSLQFSNPENAAKVDFGTCTVLGVKTNLYTSGDDVYLQDFIETELGATCSMAKADAYLGKAEAATGYQVAVGNGWVVAVLDVPAWQTTASDPENGSAEVARVAAALAGKTGSAKCG